MRKHGKSTKAWMSKEDKIEKAMWLAIIGGALKD